MNSISQTGSRSLPVRHTRWGLHAVSLGFLMVLGMAILLAQASVVASDGYGVERLENTKASLEHSNQQLEEEVASLSSLDRIEREARTRLKMVTPTSYVYVEVDTLPQDPPPLMVKALREGTSSGAQSPVQPWWQTFVRALLSIRSQS